MTEHVKVLTVKAEMLGTTTMVHPVLLWNSEETTLVDACYPGQFPELRQAIEAAGASFDRLRRVLITHQDWDHLGTLPDIAVAQGEKVRFYAHPAEKPYLEGKLPFIKLTPERIAARIAALPEALRPQATAMFARLPTARIDQLLEDGQILSVHGGITVIHTPGHTPGHICLYLSQHRLLVAGDQLRVEDGVLVGPSGQFTPDMPAAIRSLGKLLSYDIAAVACYHGGIYDKPDIAARLAELAAGQ